MGNCCTATPHFDPVNGRNVSLCSSKNGVFASREGSNGAVREGGGSLKRRDEAGPKGTPLKSVSGGANEAGIPQAQCTRAKEVEPVADLAVGVAANAEQGGGKEAGEANEVEPVADLAVGMRIDAEQGGRKNARKAKEAGPVADLAVGMRIDAEQGRGKNARKAKEAKPVADLAVGMRIDAEQGRGKDAGKAKEAKPVADLAVGMRIDAEQGRGKDAGKAKEAKPVADLAVGMRIDAEQGRGKDAGKAKEAKPVADLAVGMRIDAEQGRGKDASKAKEAKPVADLAVGMRIDAEQGRGKDAGKAKEAKPVADLAVGMRIDAEQGRGKDAGKATEAGGSETKAGSEVEEMEVGSPSERQADAWPEPARQRTPLTVEMKEPMRGGGGAVVEESNSDEDLYRGAEEIAMEQTQKSQRQTRLNLAAAQDGGSVAAAVDLLFYGQREWRGNTAKSALIRKGYEDVSQSFEGLRRVRGDNYCALRATLFQVFAQSSQLPSWLQDEDVSLWPEKLLAEKELSGQWRFPVECKEEPGAAGAVEQLKRYMALLQTRWQAAARAGSAEERQQVCAEVFRGEEEEYGLLEAVKLLMLRTAAELHARMQSGADVPVFCWLLFARDSSPCPRSFLTNHLNHVGFSGGLEQVEMFLLGYALQQTIKVYRLYKADTEEFITYYPDDHKQDWPCVCLVTEDDRHYNVLVSEEEGLPSPRTHHSGLRSPEELLIAASCRTGR